MLKSRKIFSWIITCIRFRVSANRSSHLQPRLPRGKKPSTVLLPQLTFNVFRKASMTWLKSSDGTNFPLIITLKTSKNLSALSTSSKCPFMLHIMDHNDTVSVTNSLIDVRQLHNYNRKCQTKRGNEEKRTIRLGIGISIIHNQWTKSERKFFV